MKVVVMGLGPIGRELLACAREKGDEVIHAVDNDPEKVGRDLSEIVAGWPPGVKIVSDISEIDQSGDVVLHATGSSIAPVAEQLRRCIEAGFNVVSTCEELFYPWRDHPDLARELDGRAAEAGVTVVGAGVNPGFAMDVLVLVATIPCWEVRAVKAQRVVDAATRRIPLQKKIGLGLSQEEFRLGVNEGVLGHVGLAESAWMVSDHLDLNGETILETVEPILTPTPFEVNGTLVGWNYVAGLRQYVVLRSAKREVVRLELSMIAHAHEPRDEIYLDSDPPIRIVVPEGLPGEASTAGIVVNTAHRVLDARPGLLTLADLPLPYASSAHHSVARLEG